MKSPLLTLITLLIYLTAALGINLRHRDLANKIMCLDLGRRKGLHDMKVTKSKYFNKLVKQNDHAEKGRCTEPTKKLANRLNHKHVFCKNWNKDHVTILAPEGLRKWLIKEVGATKGSCGADEDNFVEIFE
eukprot:scaffold48279_cov50-Cyclotella_meneghiniana.AAC.4